MFSFSWLPASERRLVLMERLRLRAGLLKLASFPLSYASGPKFSPLTLTDTLDFLSLSSRRDAFRLRYTIVLFSYRAPAVKWKELI